MTLYFDFPKFVLDNYESTIETVAQQTNWEVVVSPDINQQALSNALYELLPDGAQITKGPSFYVGEGYVQAKIDGLEETESLANAYYELTGFKLWW